MARFREEFTAVVHDADTPNDLSAFWLRKTKKPVLAVLLVQKPGKPFKLYRGECIVKCVSVSAVYGCIMFQCCAWQL